MTYQEYYATVKERFNNSVNTTDENLRTKILASLEKWYQKNYAEFL